MKMLRCFLVLLAIQEVVSRANLSVIKEWKEMEFYFPSSTAEQEAITNGTYTRGASFMLDMDVVYREDGTRRIFVTTPRFGRGRPMTLGEVSDSEGPAGPILTPYPDASWHDNNGMDCDGLNSVVRIAIDECNRLWALDSGNLMGEQACPAKLVAFDLNTNKVLIKHIFNKKVVSRDSLFVTPVVDVRDPFSHCEDTHVYIADVFGYSMVVYRMCTNSAWKITNPLFLPHPEARNFIIEGETFSLDDGVLGMALSPLVPRTERILYFHSLASFNENKVATSVLRNEDAFKSNSTHPASFIRLPGRRESQSAAQVMDCHGILFYGLATPTAIGCWNSATKFTAKNMDIVSKNRETLQFASGMKIKLNTRKEEELWVATCRYQKLMRGSIKPTEVNYRILAARVKDLVKDTRCCNE